MLECHLGVDDLKVVGAVGQPGEYTESKPSPTESIHSSAQSKLCLCLCWGMGVGRLAPPRFQPPSPNFDGWVAIARSHSGTRLVVNRSLSWASSFYLCIWTLVRDPKLNPELLSSCLLSNRLSYTMERGGRIFLKRR